MPRIRHRGLILLTGSLAVAVSAQARPNFSGTLDAREPDTFWSVDGALVA